MSKPLRYFTEIAAELGLEKFMATAISTLHYVPAGGSSDGGEAPMIMVRQFHREPLPPALVAPFVELNQAMAQWVAARAFVVALVRVAPPLEVGHDFISRTFFSYGASTDSYDTGAVEPPQELAWMREAVSDELGDPPNPREALLETVLARSLLQPSGKVFFDGQHFIVIEPHVTPDELRAWAEF